MLRQKSMNITRGRSLQCRARNWSISKKNEFMATGALDAEINKYLPLLGNEEKSSLLVVIKSFLSLKKESSPSIDVEQYNKEIDEAMARINNGKFTTHEDVEKEM